MKLPNGYGSVVKLSGKRRKPYAVKVSHMVKVSETKAIRKRKYIGFFSSQVAAYQFLAEYNNGDVVGEHIKYAEIPTFAEMYEKWKTYRNSLKTKPSKATWKNYGIALKFFSDIHHVKFANLKVTDLQSCVSAASHKSRSTISNMRSILNGLYNYAKMNEVIKDNIVEYVVFEHTDSTASPHTRFTDAEIDLLWKKLYVVNNVDVVLIYIYTGLRASELLEILTENVFLDKHYMVGGLKTENGYNRLIPICDKILPLVKNRLDPNKKYLINNKFGNHYTYGTYTNGNWGTVMKKLDLKHSPHDCRYTFASLADNASMNNVCLKIILGHAVADKEREHFKAKSGLGLTKGVYTQKSMAQLLKEINKL